MERLKRGEREGGRSETPEGGAGTGGDNLMWPGQIETSAPGQ